MRIRTIKPEFWTHPVMARLDDCTKLLAIGILNWADDEGYFYADPKLIRSALRPFDDDSSIVHRSLEILADKEYISIHQHPTHGDIGFVISFHLHQKVDRPKASVIRHLYDSTNDRRTIDDSSLLEGKGKEGIGREQGGEGNAQSEDRHRRIEDLKIESENQNPTAANQPKEKPPLSSATPPQKINNLQFIQADRFAQLYPDDPIAWPAMQLKFKIGNEKLKEILADFVLHRKQSSKPTDTYQEFCKHIANWYRKKIENSSGGGGLGKTGGRDDFMKDYQ
jgi:hypothetical protein